MTSSSVNLTPTSERSCSAFAGYERIAAGSVSEVAQTVKRLIDRNASLTYLVFDDATSAPIELDLRGTPADVALRYEPASAPESRPGPGRPNLGVVSREITLLPRHWEWLSSQPGGASTTLRRLVEEARKSSSDKDRVRDAQNAAYKFMMAVAGNLPHYENALRALYAGQAATFTELTAAWPKDVHEHVTKLAKGAWNDA